MYAVIKTGGKQYRVANGDTLEVEKLDAEVGQTLSIREVLMIVDGEQVTFGSPYVEGAEVNVSVRALGRGPKIRVLKFQRRKHHRKQMGHRQAYTRLEVTGITAPTTEAAANGT